MCGLAGHDVTDQHDPLDVRLRVVEHESAGDTLTV